MFMSYGIFLFIHVYMVAIENIDDDIINQLHFLFCKKKIQNFVTPKIGQLCTLEFWALTDLNANKQNIIYQAKLSKTEECHVCP